MSLLADIQNECLAKDGSVSRLLRLCLQLAARLNHKPLKSWVLHELNGYPDVASIPDYRVHHTRSLGFFADQFTQVTLQISSNLLPEPLKTRFNAARMNQPISQYEELLQGSSTDAFQTPFRRLSDALAARACTAPWAKSLANSVLENVAGAASIGYGRARGYRKNTGALDGFGHRNGKSCSG